MNGRPFFVPAMKFNMDGWLASVFLSSTTSRFCHVSTTAKKTKGLTNYYEIMLKATLIKRQALYWHSLCKENSIL